MKKFASWAVIDAALQKTLDAIPDDEKSKAWDGKKVAVTAFKDLISNHGTAVQESRCAWCTLLVGPEARRTPHRDHIAPKSIYGRWTFLPENLVIACESCNGFTIKADLDTIATVAPVYDQCDFLIVHPYHDEPSDHVGFVGEDKAVGIVIVGKSAKGLWTIDKLQLASTGLTVERVKDYMYLESINNLPPYFTELFEKATGRQGN